jgi:hypothetical protein
MTRSDQRGQPVRPLPRYEVGGDWQLAACTAYELRARRRDEALRHRVADPAEREETGNVEIRVELEREARVLPVAQSPDDVELAVPPTLTSLTVAGGSAVTAISTSKSLVSGPTDRCSSVRALLGRPRASRSSTSTVRTTSGYQAGYPSTASTRARHCVSGAGTSAVAVPRSSFMSAIYALPGDRGPLALARARLIEGAS